jgi:NAD(P)-dependent dehydrogenase (short-subunit alcohol dehydrogenase family)
MPSTVPSPVTAVDPLDTQADGSAAARFARDRHAGRRALVTGAASGIGLATALRLALEGAEVVGCDIDPAALERVGKEFDDRRLTASFFRCDVNEQADVDAVLAVAANGRDIDILVNSAGVVDDFTPGGEVSDATWDRVMSTNATGTMRLCRSLIPSLERTGAGAIVNVASIAGYTGGCAGIAYTASKHAVIGITRSVAFLYAERGIRCNAVCPGGVRTPLTENARPASAWAMTRMRKAMARAMAPADPRETAAVISWLVSDEAYGVNGAIVSADGGWTAG